jgi:hypothetical protein
MVVLRGVKGLIKWSYYNAAAIQGYAVKVAENGRWKLRAQVVMADAFKLSRRPLIFVAMHERGEWRWPIEGYELHDGMLRAELGPPEGDPMYGKESIC